MLSKYYFEKIAIWREEHQQRVETAQMSFHDEEFEQLRQSYLEKREDRRHSKRRRDVESGSSVTALSAKLFRRQGTGAIVDKFDALLAKGLACRHVLGWNVSDEDGDELVAQCSSQRDSGSASKQGVAASNLKEFAAVVVLDASDSQSAQWFSIFSIKVRPKRARLPESDLLMLAEEFLAKRLRRHVTLPNVDVTDTLTQSGSWPGRSCCAFQNCQCQSAQDEDTDSKFDGEFHVEHL